MRPVVVPLVIAAASLATLFLVPFLGPRTTLILVAILSTTTAIRAMCLVRDHMRSDVRAGWREMREKVTQEAANEGHQRQVVFSGEIGTVIVQQTIYANTAHIAGQPREEEKPPA